MLQSEDRTETSLTTDENWEVEHEKGVAAVPTPFNVLPNSYYAAEPIERIDGSTFDWSWDFSTPGPRSRWTKARSEGNATLRGSELILNWQLVADPLPPAEHKPFTGKDCAQMESLNDRAEAALRIPPNSHATVLFDNGELTTAYPELTVSGGKGGSIRTVWSPERCEK